MYTAVCRELANKKSEKRYCACAVLEISNGKGSLFAFLRTMAYSASASDFSEFSVEEVVEYLEDKM